MKNMKILGALASIGLYPKRKIWKSSKRQPPEEQVHEVSPPAETGIYPRAELRRKQRAAKKAEWQQVTTFIRTVPPKSRALPMKSALERRNTPLSQYEV